MRHADYILQKESWRTFVSIKQPPQPPEPLTFSAFKIHFIQTNPSAD